MRAGPPGRRSDRHALRGSAGHAAGVAPRARARVGNRGQHDLLRRALATGRGDAPPVAGGGEPPFARRTSGAVPPRKHPRQLAAHARGLREDQASRRQRHHGLDPRRIGHRQGTRGLRRPLHQSAGEDALRQGELRGAEREPPGERVVRPREGGVHRGPVRGPAAWRKPRAAPCSSTKSAISRRLFRSSCCGYCRSANSSAWAATGR